MADSSVHLRQMIPSRFCAPCEFCKDDLDTRAEGTHQFTTGWVMVREGGGGHGVSLAKRENRWAHKACIDRATRGTQPGRFF